MVNKRVVYASHSNNISLFNRLSQLEIIVIH